MLICSKKMKLHILKKKIELMFFFNFCFFTLLFLLPQVDLADAGSYEIAVSFPIPPYKITLGFEVEITKQLPVVQRVVGKLWIALICVAVYGLLLTLTAFCLCSKIKNIRQRLQGKCISHIFQINVLYGQKKVVRYFKG